MTPKDDPDPRPLLVRIDGDDRELAKALEVWLLPIVELVEDRDLWVRCSLLLGYTIGRLTHQHGAQGAPLDSDPHGIVAAHRGGIEEGRGQMARQLAAWLRAIAASRTEVRTVMLELAEHIETGWWQELARKAAGK